MHRKIRLKKRFLKIKFGNLITIITVAIILLALFQYFVYVNSTTNKLFHIVEVKLTNINSLLLNNAISENNLANINFDDILIVIKNKDDEVSVIDFNLNNAYDMLRTITHSLRSQLKEMELGNFSAINYYDRDITNENDNFIMNIPVGVMFDSPYLANSGPKIPVKIELMGNVFVNLKTKVTNYGINNVLLQLYLSFNINEQVYLPAVAKKVTYNYDILVASKIIQGKVPTFFGGALASESSILPLPLN